MRLTAVQSKFPENLYLVRADNLPYTTYHPVAEKLKRILPEFLIKFLRNAALRWRKLIDFRFEREQL